MLVVSKVFTELISLIFAVSLLLFFIDYLQRNRKAKLIAFHLLLGVWSLQTVQFVYKLVDIGHFPILTIREGLFFYVWVLLTISLIVSKKVENDFLVFFVNTIAFSIHTLYTFAPEQYASKTLAKQLISELLIGHISIAFISYACYTVGFIYSIMYLAQHSLIKKKKWGHRLIRFGNLNKLDSTAFNINVCATAIYLIALILGMVWALITDAKALWIDPKFIGSFGVFFIYCLYLYLSVANYLNGKNKIHWNIICFMTLIVNYFLFGRFSSFHFMFM
ncbi:MAG: cytochrome [Bacillales bacterium]|jgi:HemX protein|nr:cytochrome [Bacillales bacterium]